MDYIICIVFRSRELLFTVYFDFVYVLTIFLVAVSFIKLQKVLNLNT